MADPKKEPLMDSSEREMIASNSSSSDESQSTQYSALEDSPEPSVKKDIEMQGMSSSGNYPLNSSGAMMSGVRKQTYSSKAPQSYVQGEDDKDDLPEIWYTPESGTVECCGLYRYKVSNKVINSTEVTGISIQFICAFVACIVLGFLGIIIEAAFISEELDKQIWLYMGIVGFIVGFIFGFFGIKEQNDTLDTKLLVDMEFSQACWQGCHNKESGTITFYSLDATTPILKARLSGAREIFREMNKWLDGMANIDPADEVDIIEKQQIGRSCCAIPALGCNGCYPQRKYRFTNHHIRSKQINCCYWKKKNIRMNRVFDLEMGKSCSQFLLPKICPCCHSCCPSSGKGDITLHTFDINEAEYKFTVKKPRHVFETIASHIDATNAADIHFSELKHKGALQAPNVMSV